MGITIMDVEWLVQTMVDASVDVAAGLVSLIPYMAMKGYVLWGLLCIGVLCVEARALFLWMCPTLLRLSKPIVFLLNALIDFIGLFVNSCITVVDAIITAIDAIKTIFTGHSVHNNLIHWINLKHVSDAEYRRVISEIPPTCAKYDNMPIIFQFIVRHNIHGYTCPAVRYTYPLKWLYDASANFLGWTYYGSAAPFTDTDNENCQITGDTNADYICVGIGVGYLILELLLPIFILYIIWQALGGGIKRILNVMIWLFFKGIEIFVEMLYIVIHELEI